MKHQDKLRKPDNRIRVISVGLDATNSSRLAEILGGPDWPQNSQSSWHLEQVDARLAPALSAIRSRTASVVLCQRDLDEHSWQDLHREIASLPHPPCLIVTSSTADERLWAEALNLGAYDVLATPFDTTEVIRVLHAAWHHQEYGGRLAPAKPEPGYAAAV